ncbi:HEAT repeat-containing protein 6 [Synchiropus picturatus]
MSSEAGVLLSPASISRSDAPVFPAVPLSADAAPFRPQEQPRWSSAASGAERHFFRCGAKLRTLRPDSEQLREELNSLFDQIISENYNTSADPSVNIRPEEVCVLLQHASRLVPLTQEHLLVKLCRLIHHLLNQLKVIMDEQTLEVLLNYVTSALRVCSAWTHSSVLLALSTVVYGNGPQCHRHLGALLADDGVLLRYSAPAKSDVELKHVALKCLASVCLRIPGQPPLDDQYRSICFKVFLKTLQSPRSPDTDELFHCMVVQAALKGLQYCLSGGKWKFVAADELGFLLAALKRLMFQGSPGVNVDWAAVLHPVPLPPYESRSASKCVEAPKPPPVSKAAAGPGKQNKKRKSKGKGKKTSSEEGEEDEGEVAAEAPHAALRRPPLSPAAPTFYPSWKQNTSDSEFSDPEGGAQGKLRLYHAGMRQGALHCLLAVVKGVEKRTLYGYWSSFIPDAPVAGGTPALSLLTVVLKDPSPKVRTAALQVLASILEGSRQFLAVAEDTASPRASYTPFSFTLAAAVRELHRSLSLALLSETSPQTLTQVIKCLANLVSNAPYHRLRPGLLSPLWRQVCPFVRHREVNVRVSALTLYGALVSTQAPLPEVQLLLQQPEGSSAAGSFSPQDSALSWRQRSSASPSKRTPNPASPHLSRTPGEGDNSSPWLLRLCVALVTQPRKEPPDSEAAGPAGGALEPSPVRLEALQVLCLLVKGYVSLVPTCLSEVGQMCARCLEESDPSIQLHGAKLLEELGTGIIQQYRAESHTPESARVPVTQVVQFWSDVLSGPLNRALQNEQHHMLQKSACDALSSILPQAFAQLPDKTQLMCITMVMGLTYSEDTLVKRAAVRTLGVYILFPCLREDVMFVADTANTILAALEDKSPNVRSKAAWSLGNLTDALIMNKESVGAEFQEELSDMLLLKMLQAATRAAADKEKIKSNAMRALGSLLHFLRESQLTRPAFQRPTEDAVQALVQNVQSAAVMKTRWNACYALGNAFRNPALPLGSAPWSHHAFAALCHVVTSCTNFKVRIKSAAALAAPARRDCYGDSESFAGICRSLARAYHSSKDANDFLEYCYSDSLRHTISHALLHLLAVSGPQDAAAVADLLGGDEGPGIQEHLVKYLRAEEGGEGQEGGAGDAFSPQQRLQDVRRTLARLQGDAAAPDTHVLLGFLQQLLKACEEL